MKTVVIGAGLGGLSAAAHLVGRGHEVSVIERGSLPGGRAGLVAERGYLLDNGPTVLTMPNLLAEAFAAAGAHMADFVTIRPVDPMYRAVYADGSELRVWHGRERMQEEIASVVGPDDAAAFGRFCEWLGRLYEVEMAHFIDTNYDSVLDLLRPIAPALQLLRMGGFRKLGTVVSSYFRDERLRRIFSFQSMYAGLAPYEALALYAVITYMDSVEGVFVPEGGMHRMAGGLAAAVEKAGADLRYDVPVTRILRDGSGAVTGVEIGVGGDQERLSADAVVCNADLPVAYRTLLGGVDAPRGPARGVLPELRPVGGRRQGPPPGGCRAPQHPLRGRLGRGLPGRDQGGHADAGPVHPGHVAQPRRSGPGPGRLLQPLRARAHAEPGRPGRLGPRARAGAGRPGPPGLGPRLPRRGRGRALLRPTGLASLGHGAGHAVRAGPHVPPDRPVPTRQRGSAGTRAGVRGLRHGPRRRRAHGAHLGEAGRRAGGSLPREGR